MNYKNCDLFKSPLALVLILLGASFSHPALCIDAQQKNPQCAQPLSASDVAELPQKGVGKELDKFQSADEVVQAYGKAAREKLKPLCAKSGINYPPAHMTWVGLKQEKLLILFGYDSKNKAHEIIRYPVLGTSGDTGVKLEEGDFQIPEGFYKISRFRPRIRAHLGMQLNYPNAEDQKHAAEDGRKKLGGDILIHASYWSTGCFAMGNRTITDLYVIAHDTGLKNIDVIMSPCDPNSKDFVAPKSQPRWVSDLYKRIRLALSKLPLQS